MIVSSKFNAQVGAILHGRSYWAIRKKNGDWLSELDEDISLEHGHTRHLQWYDHVVANGDAATIVELWLFCPPTVRNPIGQRARLVIKEPWSCFVLNGTQANMGEARRYTTYQIIGQIKSKEEGTCYIFVWDSLKKQLFHGENNVYNMRPWREGSTPIGQLSLDVIGLRLG